MRALALFGPGLLREGAVEQPGVFHLDGQALSCGILRRPRPHFDPADPAQAELVLLRVLAFSVNFRDRALGLRAALHAPHEDWSYALGSEFCARVEAVGPAVTGLAPGGMVIGNGAWPESGVAGLLAGIPTNHASREWHVLHQAKLLPVPQAMSPVHAAGFSIGGQTVASMLRRLSLAPGARALVTAPTSNTSLFAIAMLRAAGVVVDGLSRGGRHREALERLGIRHLLVHQPAGPPLSERAEVLALLAAEGGYDAVIDPFSDLWLTHTIPLLRSGGRYITCGFENQSPVPRQAAPPRQAGGSLMTRVMQMNLSIIGNCIGQTEDLQRAIAEHATGRLPVVIDSVHEADPAGFLARSFVDPARFGKVIWRWS
ncbi:quinone oxidoreductase family protein [Falsiroseomonas sp.]|uniref:quinone oxidoreductase family protein n=1 Tax=Falsiroseomonas sp. TaxID=2870721 RepID=UPI003F708BF3